MPFSGIALLITAGINPTSRAWLWISIVLYAATLVYLVVRQRPRLIRLLHGERSPQLVAQLRYASLTLIAVIVVIAATMILKPGR